MVNNVLLSMRQASSISILIKSEKRKRHGNYSAKRIVWLEENGRGKAIGPILQVLPYGHGGHSEKKTLEKGKGRRLISIQGRWWDIWLVVESHPSLLSVLLL